jgi:threonine dehydratase
MVNNTPVERYEIEGKPVFVKREDLCTSDMPKYPPLAKLRGASVLLERLHSQGIRLVANLDTLYSKSGQGVAAICRELDMQCIVAHPSTKDKLPPQLHAAQELGAELLALRPNYVRIHYAQMKRYVESKGGYALPFGLTCVESTLAVAEEAKTVPNELLTGTLIICVGTGTILSGILLGLKRLPKIIGVSSGMSFRNQEKNIKRLLLEANASLSRLNEIDDKLTILPPIMPYAEKDTIDCPWPVHRNYDAKAFHFLLNNILQFEAPIIFWNVGS